MTKRIRPFSEGNALSECPRPQHNALDLKNEYKSLRSFLHDEKLKEEEEWRGNLPFKAVYLLILVLLSAFFVKGIISTLEEEEIEDKKFEQ